MRYFHGSAHHFETETILRGRCDAYHQDWSGTDFYRILEANRPSGSLPHAMAVFMASDDDLDNAGGSTDWVLELDPIGLVRRHDLNWSSQISCLVADGYPDDHPKVVDAARQYWMGTPHPDESVWEYLAQEARVVTSTPWESDIATKWCSTM